MSTSKKPGAAFEVGRGKPPRHSRFKPGQSGNPGGRRRGSQNLQTVLQAVLESEIELNERGRNRKLSMLEALLKCQIQLGLRGNNRAIDSVLDRVARYEGIAPPVEEDLASEDEAILARILAGRRGKPPLPSREGNGRHPTQDDPAGEADDE